MQGTRFSVLLACLLLLSSVPATLPQIYSIYISTESLPSGTVGLNYQGNLQALYTGAIPMPLLWTVYDGSLPPGLSLASAGPTTASISGTPTQAGSWEFTIEAYKNFTPGGYVYHRKQFTIDIAATPPTEFDFSISITPEIQAVDINDVVYENGVVTITLGISVSLLGGTTRDVTLSVWGILVVIGDEWILAIEEGDGIETNIFPEVWKPPFMSKLVITITPAILPHLLQARSRRVAVVVLGEGDTKEHIAKAHLDLDYLGDLSPIKLEPVQVLFGVPLVANKPTVFRIIVNSTFWHPVSAHVLIEFERGWSWSNYVTSSRVDIAPGVSQIYLPLLGDLYWVTFLPSAPSCAEVVTIDWLNEIEEHSESNNDAHDEGTVLVTRNLRLWYVPVMFQWEASTSYGSQALVDEWTNEVGGVAARGSSFVDSTYPIWLLSYGIGTAPFYYVANDPTWSYDEATETFSDIRLGGQIANADQWRALDDWDQACNLALIYNELTVAAWLAGYDRAVGVVPTLWLATFFPWIEGAANIVGLAWSSQTKGAVLVVRQAAPIIGCVVAHEIAHTYGVEEKYDEVTGRFSVRSDEGFSVSDYYPITAADYWSFMDFYNPNVQYWVDLDTYLTLLASIAFGDPRVIAIRGLVASNGTVILEPFHLIEGASIDAMPGSVGTHYVVLLGSDGTTLTRVGFNATFSAFIDPVGLMSFDVVPFAFRFAWDNRTRTIEIRDATGRVLARRSVSLNLPVVNVTFPANGDALTAAPQVSYEVTWSASDPDGDVLSYSLLYSPDNGTTWHPLATDISNSYFVLRMAGFGPSNASMIRVIASDGVNIGAGECRFKVATSTASYVVQVQPQGVPSGCQVSISVDGTPVARVQGGLSKTFAFAAGTSHVIAVDDVVSGEGGIRYCLMGGSLEVSGPGVCRFAYSTEYFLDVKSEYGATTGSGWHMRNENATFSATPEGGAGGILGLLGMKYKFKSWSGHSSATTASATILMDGPKEVVAVMELDYAVPASAAVVGLLLIGGIWFALRKRRREMPPPP